MLRGLSQASPGGCVFESESEIVTDGSHIAACRDQGPSDDKIRNCKAGPGKWLVLRAHVVASSFVNFNIPPPPTFALLSRHCYVGRHPNLLRTMRAFPLK
jgi:hypothetical protein